MVFFAKEQIMKLYLYCLQYTKLEVTPQCLRNANLMKETTSKVYSYKRLGGILFFLQNNNDVYSFQTVKFNHLTKFNCSKTRRVVNVFLNITGEY